MPFLVSRVMCLAMTSSFSVAFVARARPERPARRADLRRIVAYGDGRRAGGRPGDVMSDPCAARTATSFGQRRESRAAKARDAPEKLCFGGQVAKRRRSRPQGPARGVDAFDGACHPPEANCQSKRKTLPREGRRMGNPLSTSINPTTFTFDQLNKI